MREDGGKISPMEREDKCGKMGALMKESIEMGQRMGMGFTR